MADKNRSLDQALAQLESVRAMLAAAELDWDRLEDLRSMRNDYEPAEPCTAEERWRAWAEANPDEARELAELDAIAGDCEDQEDAQQRIYDDPLSVEVRNDWHAPGAEPEAPSEFQILLCTGGPAVRIMGDLDGHGQPMRAYLQHQDWGTPWTDYIPDGEANDVLCRYASFHLGY